VRRTLVLFAVAFLCSYGAFAADPDPIVLGSCNVSVAVGWTNPNDCTQPLSTADAGWASLNQAVASPAQYFEQTFTAGPGAYHIWLRLRALNNSKWNDAVWVQFSDALDGNGQPLYRIGTTTGLLVNLATDAAAGSLNGWGWQDGAYWLNQTTTVRYATSGPHTIRVQVREDGVSVDQIILSSSTYLNAAPGGPTNDPTRFVAAPPTAPAPGAVTAPTPALNATNVATATTLSWVAGANTSSYDISFGTANPPPTAATNQTATTYQPATLAAGTTYYWRVDARGAGGTTTGPLWSFTTAAPQTPAPGAPTTPTPALGATNIAISTPLAWVAGANSSSYDVSFGTTNPPPIVTANQTATTYQPAAALASNTTYYWRINAHGAGGTTAGALWSFTTAAPATPAPSVPSGPTPANGSANALPNAALNWAASTNATSYDVSFGTVNPPPLVSSNQQGTSYQAQSSASTTYYWKVDAIGAGGRTAGPIWTFTTGAPTPPPPPPPPPAGDVPSTNNTVLKRLRVFNWNVAMGYNLITKVNDYNMQLDMIASFNPDVITLEEMTYSDADMMTIYLDGLTQRTGRTWHGYYQRGNSGTDPKTNNIGGAILTWLPVDAESQTLFTDDPAHTFEVIHIQVTVNGAPVHISTTHLFAWDTTVRANQLALFQNWLSSQGGRRIVAGDFNAFPGDATTWIPAWTAEYKDAWVTATSWIQPTGDGGFTFDKRTATGNPERIDYHWTKGVNVSEMFVVKTQRSDHHALVADYNVP